MTHFDDRLWRDTDPTYAPFLNKSGQWFYWRPARKRWQALGWRGTHVRLEGVEGDGKDAQRAAECRALTRAMLRELGIGPVRTAGTWGWLIDRYMFDAYSPFVDVKGNTAASYRWLCSIWMDAIGEQPIASMTYEQARQIELTLRTTGRTLSYIHRVFTMLRTLASYGAKLRAKGAADVSAILSGMRIRMPPKRQVAPSRAQVLAVVDAADAAGLHGFACGLMIQWVTMLRGVDVFGQWLPAIPGEGGIVRGHERWADGLTWDMFAPDLSSFSKVISKTAKSMPGPMTFDLSACPEIRSRLRLLGSGGRIGPVIVQRDGVPYTTMQRGKTWARLASKAGLPAGVRMMDTRAGAITEAKNFGVDGLILRDAAQHLQATTTNDYARGRDQAAAKVISLRGER